jgi:hypothetical protein
MFKKTTKPPKKTLADLLQDKTVITGKEVIKRIKDAEVEKQYLEEAIEFERRNRRTKK